MTASHNSLIMTRMMAQMSLGRQFFLCGVLSGMVLAGATQARATDAPVVGAVPVAMSADGSVSAPLSSLPAPTGEVILTVTGAIALTNTATDAGPAAALDLALIEAIGLTHFTTATVWTDGPRRFDGVDLARLLAALGAQGSTLRLTALNDYAVEFPIAEAVPGGPMLALRMEEAALSPRDKGPLWMIYPFDQKEEYQNEISYSRSIWQLSRIEVLP